MVLGAGEAEGSAQSPINKGFLQTEQVLLGLSVSDSRPARGELLISYILRKDGWYLSSSKSLSRSRPFPNGFGNYLLSYIHLKSSDSITGLLLVGWQPDHSTGSESFWVLHGGTKEKLSPKSSASALTSVPSLPATWQRGQHNDLATNSVSCSIWCFSRPGWCQTPCRTSCNGFHHHQRCCFLC